MMKHSFSILPLDVHNDIYSFLSNKDLYNVLTVSKEVKMIADRCLQPQINNNKAIKSSSRNNNILAVRRLLRDPRVDPSVDGNDPIRYASKHGYDGVVKLLLQHPRVDPSDIDNYSIEWACINGHTNVVKLLLRDPGEGLKSPKDDILNISPHEEHVDWTYSPSLSNIKLCHICNIDETRPKVACIYNNQLESTTSQVFSSSSSDQPNNEPSIPRGKFLSDGMWKNSQTEASKINSSCSSCFSCSFRCSQLLDLDQLHLHEEGCEAGTPTACFKDDLRQSSHIFNGDLPSPLLSVSFSVDAISLSRPFPKSLDVHLLHDISHNKSVDHIHSLMELGGVSPPTSFGDDCERETVFLYPQLHKVDPTKDNNYPLRSASKYGHVEVVRLLLNDPRVDPSDKDDYSIGVASENGHTDVVRLLLQHPKTNPSADNNHAFNHACRRGHMEIAKLLLSDPRFNDENINEHSIGRASRSGRTELVRLLLQDHRIDPSHNDNYSIIFASFEGYVDIVKILITDP